MKHYMDFIIILQFVKFDLIRNSYSIISINNLFNVFDMIIIKLAFFTINY